MLGQNIIIIGSIALFVLIALGFRHSRNKWNKLYHTFKADSQFPWNQNSNGSIEIDGDRFKSMVIVITKTGLKVGPYGLLPRLFFSGSILIPWTACSSLTKKTRTVFGVQVSEYDLNVQAQDKRIRVGVPNDIAAEIIQNGYVN